MWYPRIQLSIGSFPVTRIVQSQLLRLRRRNRLFLKWNLRNRHCAGFSCLSLDTNYTHGVASGPFEGVYATGARAPLPCSLYSRIFLGILPLTIGARLWCVNICKCRSRRRSEEHTSELQSH